MKALLVHTQHVPIQVREGASTSVVPPMQFNDRLYRLQKKEAEAGSGKGVLSKSRRTSSRTGQVVPHRSTRRSNS